MNLDVGSLQVLSTKEPDRWRALLPAGQSAFGSLEFASIAERHKRGIGRLILFNSKEGHLLVAYPLLLRAVSELPFVGCTSSEAWDAASPEYTGPLALEPCTEVVGRAFRRLFDQYCQDNRIVTEFAHLHPWRTAPGSCRPENVHLDREIIYVDLTQSEEDLWRNSLTRACRKNISRARSEKMRVFAAEKPDQICQFHQIYLHTMDRNQAQTKYYYPLEFFMDFHERMSVNARFALAEHSGKIVAGTLFLHDDHDVFSYLGGAYHADQGVRPTNALIYETIRWARDEGKRRLILGGGYAPNDGIFRFKASFSPLRAGFSVYRQVHMPDRYGSLCAEWAVHHGADPQHDSFFPQYREIPENGR
jgi:CelD/BcsL family acetyltransferase involved in cellulose biosynthesis